MKPVIGKLKSSSYARYNVTSNQNPLARSRIEYLRHLVHTKRLPRVLNHGMFNFESLGSILDLIVFKLKNKS